jgi:cyclic beta-1,2-glucan synthetase
LKLFFLRVGSIEPTRSPWNSDAVIREELFSVKRLEEHAASLARSQPVTKRPRRRRSLNARLRENESVLLAAYRTIAAAVGAGAAITPAAEWLLDNYHLIEEQIRKIRSDLPPSFYRQLPKLADGPFIGYPRVFGIAWACVAHGDSRFEVETLRRFVRAYQRVQPLTIGELWAIAITLGIVLVENLRRVASRIVSSRVEREQADGVADRLLGVNGVTADQRALLHHCEKHGDISAAFVVQVVKRLRDQDPRVTPALEWLEQRLVARGTSSDAMVHSEHQRQGATNVTVRNIFTSMRLIADVNWSEFFEDVSLVDVALRDATDLATMDFATRNMYRSAIEALSRRTTSSELQVADALIRAIRASAAADPNALRRRDPGYHLLGRGRRAFEQAIGYRRPIGHWPSVLNDSLGPSGYIAAVLALAVVIVALPVAALFAQDVASLHVALCAVLGLIPAIDLAVALVNRAVMRGFDATMLPGLALREGVPAHMRTMVVVPTLLTTRAALETLLERLEVHYLASTEGELHFALLTDWADAASEHTPGDAALLQVAVEGIARLNRTHSAPTHGERFYVLHRHRAWSSGQQQWMGWERKRGKLHELNQLLRGATDTSFMDVGDARVPTDVRYVITLDADTRLPREAVRRLIGKLAHPLNHPRFDSTSGRVLEGYAVLQPRVTPSLAVGREGSLFQRIFSTMTGIDAYGSAASDVYQDLFGEGSYAGKGIYDVDAFEAALAGRVPQDSLLSHDLFEGTFARAGLVSDVEVVEEFPARYDVWVARNHRWARGDWQLLPWLLGRGDTARRGNGSLPLLGRWKMLDNLRRTLSAPASILALFTGWLLPLHAALGWTAFVMTTIALPVLLPVISAVVPRRGIVARSHLRALRHDLVMAFAQIALLLTFLAHQTWLMCDAILRTLYRLTVSRRLLLEWVTAAQAQLSSRLGLSGIYRRMSASVVIALIALVAVAGFAKPGFTSLWLALPFVIAWMAAPAIAFQLSKSPLVAGRLPVGASDRQTLRLVARRTWRYFETFVTTTDHMLPPDNFQEDPQPTVAHRTSPTNIGLYFLCAVSARDFGWIGTLESVERMEATLATLHRLQTFRGHFYNWYDTRDLRPLEPAYVSSVDSGNLAAHLIAAANACREWLTAPITNAAHRHGVADAARLAADALLALPDDRRAQTQTRHQLADALTGIDTTLRGHVAGTVDMTAALAQAGEHATILSDGARALASEHDDAAYSDLLFWTEATQRSIQSWQRDASQTEAAERSLEQRLLALEAALRALANAMEFGFLLDPQRKLLAIGYRVADAALDENCYDLLASEARLASFFSIAKNDVPTRHWFRLGRAVTSIGSGAALISWSGSMFEYLMPSLVMRAPAGSLLEQTNRLIVRRQIDYGASREVPWGVSESAYSARDLELTYQYSNFGVPGLGLKRGLSENLVIAPYATALAAMVDPQAALRNLVRLTRAGALGRHGFYEALDYTRARLPKESAVVIVKAYMAHHQGMTIVAIANVLFDGRMRARFHAEPSVQAAELLLQERTPRDVSVAHPRAEEVKASARISDSDLPAVRRLHTTRAATPQTHMLSNGRYAVMLTSAGSGYSRWGAIGVTRWREDVTRDDSGSYLFVRDVASAAVWSPGFQPCGVEPDSYEVTFAEDRAEFVRTDATLTTTLEVVVSPEDDAEVRRLSIANTGPSTRELDITSYSELTLAPPAADTAHPAFSKLFVETQFIARLSVLLATRRKRSPHEPEIWASHHVVVEGEVVGALQYETDRARFLGRGREVYAPAAVIDGHPLSNTCGTILDPIFALRQRVRIAPGATARLSFWTSVAATRAGLLDLLDKHQDANAYGRAATLSWTKAQVQLRHLGVTAAEASLFQRIAGHVLYADASLRPSSAAIRRGGGPQSALWVHGISGDRPIVLLRIEHIEDIALAKQLLQAHEYWRLKQLAVDLVILNEHAASYVEDLQNALETSLRTHRSQPRLGAGIAEGSVFVLRMSHLGPDMRTMLSSAARIVFVGARGTLADQLDRRAKHADVPAGSRRRMTPDSTTGINAATAPDLEFFNGIGGFAAEGREYVATLYAGETTPAPWINVIANSQFGFQIAMDGGGYTWSINSRENQLTAWSNDPVTDRPGEVLYVRDEDTGELWGPTVAPVCDPTSPYEARHGQGYSRFQHDAHQIALDLLVYVPLEDSIKISRLRIRNLSGRRRRLSVTAYVEWVLGTSRSASAPFVMTEIDAQTGAMFARNPWSGTFGARVAFADLGGRQTQWTGDRREFLGRHGSLEQPAALTGNAVLSGRVGAGLDPCGAMQASIVIEPGQSVEIVFLLGEAASQTEAQVLVQRYRTADLDAVLARVNDFWEEVLGKIQVKTPDRSLDIMLNRWMLYQTLACRTWARSAFYQASGAYGFRDQLQDGMALVTAQPSITREHLLRAASRQFAEGDVQHWWLPPSGQGVRTRISDDRVWLAYAAAHYVTRSGDVAILQASVPFIEGGKLQHGEHDSYFQPNVSDESATLFEHCARGLDASLALGAHGLPLMGTGDWNDGMNRVGEHGRGESVWLGWFLYATLRAFAPIAQLRNEIARAARWTEHAAALREALERDGWDGSWYRRGYFDDGAPLGSVMSEECRIDSIAQSWCVLSGAADPARALQAMAAADEQLVRRDAALALLFTPPFDRTPRDPGYVKGYPPGVRENGGQYTHAAAWLVMAFAQLGQTEKAAELFALLNPINRTSTRTAVRRYKVEPYAVAADVYSVAPHVGRGGWTWYTGSAGWMYRAGIEGILGLHVQGESLLLTPCIPQHWPRFDVVFKHRSSRYEITVRNPQRVSGRATCTTVDGITLAQGACCIPLLDDGATHHVEMILG